MDKQSVFQDLLLTVNMRDSDRHNDHSVFLFSLAFPRGTIGFWMGARRPRGSHSKTCMFEQWRWLDVYGRAHGVVSGFSAFVPGKPDK